MYVTLNLDLDGFLANFDRHAHSLGIHPRGVDDTSNDDDMWAKINAHPSFFRDIPPCPGALEFFESVRHLHPVILTACPKSAYQSAAIQKREWVRHHLGRDVRVMPVYRGINKPLFMHAPGDILIDDSVRNIEAWNAHGGHGILHRNFADTHIALAMAGIRVRTGGPA